MEFVWLGKKGLENAAREYAVLANRVLKGDHSIGFVKKLNAGESGKFISAKLSGPKTAILLVHENNKLIGTGIVMPTPYRTTQHYCELSKIMVEPAQQGKGIGRKIVEKLEEKALEMGFSDVYVSTWDIPHIVRFYKECGYAHVGGIPHFVKDTNGKFHDSHIFVKRLEKQE